MKQISEKEIEIDNSELNNYFFNNGISIHMSNNPFRFPGYVEKYLKDVHKMSVRISHYEKGHVVKIFLE